MGGSKRFESPVRSFAYFGCNRDCNRLHLEKPDRSFPRLERLVPTGRTHYCSLCVPVCRTCVTPIVIHQEKKKGFFGAPLFLKMNLGINFFWILGCFAAFRLFYSYESKKVRHRFPDAQAMPVPDSLLLEDNDD